MANGQVAVYAMFPITVRPGGNLDMDPENWNWVHCLTIPRNMLSEHQFSQWPYKWIRFAIGVVIGALGQLSTSQDSVHALNDNVPQLQADTTSLYYHVNDDEKQRMFPIDPDTERSQVTSSAHTSRSTHFRPDVAERDGMHCIMTGVQEDVCDAVHLLAHSKGDQYISTFTEHRSRDETRGNIVNNIDDIRNGLFLNVMSHIRLGKDLAFLMTPNFAMNTTDVDPAASPQEKRCTSHRFVPPTGNAFDDAAMPLGTSLQIANINYPPAILFDAVYAGAVLHHFGTTSLKEQMDAWKDTFYPGGVRNIRAAEAEALTGAQTATEERIRHQAENCQLRSDRRDASRADTFDMLMAIPYLFIPHDQVQAMLRANRERAEEAEQKHVQEKVDAWVKQVIPG